MWIETMQSMLTFQQGKWIFSQTGDQKRRACGGIQSSLWSASQASFQGGQARCSGCSTHRCRSLASNKVHLLLWPMIYIPWGSLSIFPWEKDLRRLPLECQVLTHPNYENQVLLPYIPCKRSKFCYIMILSG